MPDILIRGMDKPGGCRDCDFCSIQDAWFEILYFCKRNNRYLDDEEACNIPNDCPIIELPPHGDLIDRSELNNSFESSDFDGEPHENVYSAICIVNSMPVIVPGNKEVNKHE